MLSFAKRRLILIKETFGSIPLISLSENNNPIIDILSQLISFDTTTSNDTLEAVFWVKRYLKNYGLNVRLIYNPSKTRASLVASFIRNTTDKSVIFCGHLDVVPVNQKNWQTNPFALTKKQDKLFGRGASDMKGGIAVILSLVPTLIQQQKNFIIILTHNEETTGTGIQEVLNDSYVRSFLHNVAGCIVAEPTNSCLVLGHKTATAGTITLTGKPAHSSHPDLAVNALFHAVEIYKNFYFLASRLSQQTDNDFEIPHSVADILIFNAGTAVNVIPAEASLTYSCRFISEQAEQTFLAELEKDIYTYANQIKGLSVHFDNHLHIPALETTQNNLFVQKLLSVFAFGPYKKVSFGTEAGYFSLLGIPTVVCGPGNIEQAHQDNEFITEEQLYYYYNQLKQLFL